MKKILFLIITSFVLINAHEYDVYDMNGKNRGTYNGVLNKSSLIRFAKEYHGSVLVKKKNTNKTGSLKNLSSSKFNLVQLNQIKRTIVLSNDSLSKEEWIEAEKNEIIKICLNNKAPVWETSLNAAISNDSCLAFQAPTIIGVDAIKVYFPNADSSHKINLAVGMKYLDFKNEEVLLGYNEFTDYQLRGMGFAKNPDPERLVKINAKYLVDEYPVTNCDFLQIMWDSIPEKSSYNADLEIEHARKKWLARKKTIIRHENCAAHDTAASTISLYQAMKYANARSIREGLKPYYIFSTIKDNDEAQEKFVDNGYIVAYWDFKDHEDNYVLAIIDSTSDGYRLPYLDEWSMFARGGDKKNKAAPWGDSTATLEEAAKHAIFGKKKDYFYAEPVGQRKPNGYGIYDMFGLVWQRVFLRDYLEFNYIFPTCLKGGGFELYWKTTNYATFETGDEGVLSGFRLVRKLK